MSAERIGLAFLGAGAVGGPTIEETIKLASSEGLDIRGVLVREVDKKRAFDLPVTTDFDLIIKENLL